MARSATERVFDRAENLLSTGPQIPQPPKMTKNVRKLQKRLMDIETALSRAMNGWRIELVKLRSGFKADFEEDVRISDDEIGSLRKLEQLIITTQESNTARKILHYLMSLSFEQLESAVANQEGAAELVRDTAARLIKETTLEYDARVDFLELLENFYRDRSYLKIPPTSAALRASLEACEREFGTEGAAGSDSQLNRIIQEIKRFGLPVDFIRDGEVELAKSKTEIEQFNHAQWEKFNVMKSSVLASPVPAIVEMIHEAQIKLSERERSLREDCDVTRRTIETISRDAASEHFSEEFLRRGLGYRLEPKVILHQATLKQLDAMLELLAQIDPDWRREKTQQAEKFDRQLVATINTPAHTAGGAVDEQRALVARWGALAAACVTIFGFIIGIAVPGPVTGSLFPIGLGLWWTVGTFARVYDLA
jgi:hypothetical protein